MRRIAWTNLVLLVPFGTTLAVAPWFAPGTSAREGTGFTLAGLAFLAVPVLSWLCFLAPPRPDRRVRLVAGPALEVRLRPHRLLAVVVLGVTWSAWIAWAMVALGLDGPGWLLLPFLLLFLSLLPDTVRALARRPRLRIDAVGLDLRSWQRDAALAWEDVVEVGLALPNARQPQLRVRGRPGAPSWRARRSRLLHLLEPREEEVLDVPLLALDAPEDLRTFLDALRRDRPGQRGSRIDATGVAFLDGSIRGAVTRT